MKANELMIGDWVLDGGVNAQVTSITCDGNIETTKRMSNEEIVEPIPLKRIHLAKNEFKADEEDETFIYKDGYEVRISFDDGCKELELEPYIYLNINFAEKCLSMPIEYVHELQQAMRIMGCEKEIKL